MPVTHITPAIVLRSRPFGESDKIVSFLTQDLGKITGIAKGASRSRKRFVNSLEPFSLINLQIQDYSNRTLAFIVSADLLFGLQRLGTSLKKIFYASYMVEITEGLVAEREENPLVFKHLKDGLRLLSEDEPSLRFLTGYELALLGLTGYQPALDNCKRCGREGDIQWHFSLPDGGILCDPCARARHPTILIGAASVKILNQLQKASDGLGPNGLLPSSVVTEIRSLMQQFIEFHMDRKIKSASFLRESALA